MEYMQDAVLEWMRNDRYPRSSGYDPAWIIGNAMGSHCLWLQESLSQVMALAPDMRVLDMGCGKAISSIFLAKEFGVRVWAADLWNDPTDNWQRVEAAGAGDHVFPIRADAADMPFPSGFFDAMVSVNSLFFNVDGPEFLRDRLVRLVKPGGTIGVIVPGFHRAYEEGVPEALRPYWSEQLDKWHTLDWWRRCFVQTGDVELELADTLPDGDGTKLFHDYARITGVDQEPFHVLAGENITFMRLVATRRQSGG